MRKSFLLLTITLFLLLSSAVSAQTPTQAPAPAPADDSDVVKISTTLIQVDATVTDKKGNIVRDLKPEDFEIYENGKKQEITNFSFVLNVPQSESTNSIGAKSNEKGKISLPLPSVKLKPEQVRRTYALVVDDLGLSSESIYWIKNSLKKFINEQMQEGDLVALLRVSGGIGALQSFTSDKRLLLAAAEKIRWNGMSRTGVNSYEPIRELTEQQGDQTQQIQNREFQENVNDAYRESFALGTLGALNYVIKGMNNLPGRKSLMLFSEGVQIFEPRRQGSINVPRPNRAFESLRILAELANRSSVVIYTMDPRGVTIPGLRMAADDLAGNGLFDVNSDDPTERRERMIRGTQDSLRYLAQETGGLASFQNNLNSGIKKALDDQTGFYLIGYQPDTETFDAKKNKFNKLTVKIIRPNLKIRYRSGFFGVTDEQRQQTTETPNQQLAAALTSPFGASGINIDLYSIFYNDDQNRSFIRSLVYIDPKDLKFTLEPDGLYKAKFDVIAMIFDSNGQSAGNNINPIGLQFNKEQFQKIQERGIIYDLPVPISKTGAYQYRVALRDSATGKIGAASQFIEIPDLKKKKLTLSNLIVKNYSIPEWKKVLATQNASPSSNKDTLYDTVTRRFTQGSVFMYSFVIYNAKTDAAKKPNLQLQTRLFREGKLIMESDPSPIGTDGQTDLQRLSVINAVTLGTDLQPGEYILQVVVADKLAKEKKQIAAQSMDFEIIK